MRKRLNSLDARRFLNGFSFNDYTNALHDPARAVSEIERVGKQCNAGEFVIGTRDKLPPETYYAIAEMAAKKKIYFGIIYAYQFPPEGERSSLNAELVANIERIAGDYFLGEYFGEYGTNQAAKDKGYYVEGSTLLALQMPPQDFKDMQEAKDHYVSSLREMIDYNHAMGLHKSMLIEPTAFHKYNLEAGIGTAVLETMPGNPESLTAFTRGASIGYGRKEWWGYIANEWYGGYYHEDPIKAKRLALAYRWLYMSGANMTNLESGSTGMRSFGYKLEENSPECTEYRRVMRAFDRFASKDTRPPCGPLAKVAFVHGNLDGFTEFLGGYSWCQFGRPEWAMGPAEKSWDILSEVYRGGYWHDFTVHSGDGDDLTCAPAYGMYDVIPAESPAEVFCAYDLLIFTGWHTMTDAIWENLKEFVRRGGHLLISAAHLNPSPVRGGAHEFIGGGKLADFLGAEITGWSPVNSGIKFNRNTMLKNVFYPGPKDMCCDANFPCGYADWAEVKLCGGKAIGVFSDTFDTPQGEGETRPFLIENAYGKGVVSFLTNVDYPGHTGVYKIYKTVVKELLTATHRSCDLKVVCSDKVRFSFFYDDASGEEKLYLLNTDFSLPMQAVVRYRGKNTGVSLKAGELKAVVLAEGVSAKK